MKRLINFVSMLLLGATIVVSFGSVASATPQSTECSPYNKSTKYVICVDVSAQVGSVRSAKNGVIGPKVIATFVLTSSRVDSGKGDSLTQEGHFVVYGYQEKTKSGLRYYLQFGLGEHSDQGLHYYSKVGAGYDSHGCVRETLDTARSVWYLLVAGPNGNQVEKGRVEIHVYP